MTLKDGLIFFASCATLLFIQRVSKERGSLIFQISSVIIGVILFALVIYGDELFSYLARWELPTFLDRLVALVRDEVLSAYELLMIPFGCKQTAIGAWLGAPAGCKYTNFSAWFHGEAVKMGGSIYKMVSIYPKLFVAFFIFNIVPFRST